MSKFLARMQHFPPVQLGLLSLSVTAEFQVIENHIWCLLWLDPRWRGQLWPIYIEWNWSREGESTKRNIIRSRLKLCFPETPSKLDLHVWGSDLVHLDSGVAHLTLAGINTLAVMLQYWSLVKSPPPTLRLVKCPATRHTLHYNNNYQDNITSSPLQPQQARAPHSQYEF